METIIPSKISFGDFELDGARRRIFKDGEPVALNSRTFDLLWALIERKGEILSKDELLEKVWEGQFVEEGNLTVHISTLRKILGEKKDENRFIVTIPGRGYSFVAELNQKTGSEITVETHSLSQIVVEEEIEESAEGENLEGEKGSNRERETAVSAKFLSPSPYLPISLSTKLAIVFIIALALSAGGYFLFRRSAKTSTFPFQQTSIKRLTTTGNVSRAAISPDSKLFVYAIPEGEEESLWLGHVDGGEPVQIRPPSKQIYGTVKFTPDGSSIYYTVIENYGQGTLYKMPVFGGAPEKIRDNFNNFTFGPDGKQFTFLRYDENKKSVVLMTANVDQSNEREIAVLPGEIGNNWHSPAWSSDGLKIAVAATSKFDKTKLFVVNAGDGSTRPLTIETWEKLEAITWLKDGSGLIAVGIEKNALLPQLWFISFPDGEVRRLISDLNDYGYVTSLGNDGSLLALQGISQSNVWVAPADKLKEAKQITFSSAGSKDGWNGLVWTADGRIIYAVDTSDGTTLWIMNADGSKQKQLIPNGGINSYPSITADGRSIIFQSNRSGHYAVWRADLDGGNMSQLTGEQTAGQASVAPDGKWILYNSNIDSPGQLWRISIDGGQPFRLTQNRAGWAQISPDSKSVAAGEEIDGRFKLAIISLEDGKQLKTFETPRLANFRLGVHWTPDGKSITYRDWSNGIWKQNLEGGEPKRMEGLPEEKLFCYGWSPDGKSFAFTRGSTERDVVLISNVK
jgi:Tol biopolymer transport system component/DNA-binding winged helix-turn-helix (wHTH) protein